MDSLLRVLGGVLAVVLAVGSAVLEAFTPQWWVVVAAFAANVFLYWFAQSTMDRHWAWWLPAVAWTVTVIFAVLPSPEGDQIAADWRGLALLAVGGFGFLLPAAARPRPPRRKIGQQAQY